MSVFFENELDTEIPAHYQDIVEDIIEASLDFLKCPYECEVNVIFTDHAGIQAINKEYRDIDAPTDVLSFPMIEYEVPGEFDFCENSPLDYFNQDTGELMLGDIVISKEKVVSQAEEYGHSIEREYAFLIAHSMLHLFGFDHMEEEERAVMERKQAEILERLQILR